MCLRKKVGQARATEDQIGMALSAVNLIIKSKPVNWKAITGG